MNLSDAVSVLHVLEGEQLSSVTFVQDYIQLHFDGPCLTAYVWPNIFNQGILVNPKSSAYRNELCDFIGGIVVKALVEPEIRIAIQFANEKTLEISLKEIDRDGHETATFLEQAGKGLSVW
jgi:hypothetical protein